MVLYKDMDKVWETTRENGTLRLQAAPSVKARGKEQNQNSSQKGQPDRSLWPSNREAVSLSNHPRTKPEDFSLTHLSPPSSCLCIPIDRSNQEPESRRAFWKSLSVNQTEKRKQHIQREKGKIASREIMWIAQITQIWDIAGVFFSELLPTLTDSWMKS